MSKIQIVRLISGEDIIAEVDIISEDMVNFKNAIVAVAMPARPGERGPNVGFAPWQPFSKSRDFTIDRAHVISINEPLDDFVTQYQAMNSNLALPSKNKLILPN